MTSVSTDDDEKLAPGRIVAAIILAVLAIAFLVAACIYVTTPSNQLPGFLGQDQSSAHHTARAAGSLVIGLAFAIGAWFALRYQSLALEEAREAERAALAEAEAATAATSPAAQPAPADQAGQPEDSEQSGQPAPAATQA